MAGKKYENKFTIQFNAADPVHQQIIEILNQQGRKKAQFLVNAIQHYIHCSETPEIPQSYSPDIHMIESIVLRILNERNCQEAEKKQTTDCDTPSGTIVPEAHGLFSNEEITTFNNAIAMFRKK